MESQLVIPSQGGGGGNEQVMEMIQKHLSPKEKEKKLFGEVFTPVELVDDVLVHLPASVWTNKNLKWLDPANGIGNFIIMVYYKLMTTLKSVPLKDRSRCIIEEMLYMNELNPTNVALSRKIFKMIDSKATPNINKGDFLKGKLPGSFPEEFNVIVGNPPFQTPKKEETGTTAGKGTLWDDFVVKSVELLGSGGILGFITPATWRRPESKLYELMTRDNQLLYLHIFGEKQTQELFHVNARVDLYVISKNATTQNKNTLIVDENGRKHKIDVKKWPFIPNYCFEHIQKILTTEDKGIDVIFSTVYHGSNSSGNVSRKKTEKYKYPVVHGITLEGLQFLYTDDKSKGHFGVPKVLLNFNRNQYPVNDFEGKYGMSQISFGIPIKSKKQGDDIVRAINSDNFKEIIKATKWGVFQTDYHMFKYFKPNFYKNPIFRKTSSSSTQKRQNVITAKKRSTRKIRIHS